MSSRSARKRFLEPIRTVLLLCLATLVGLLGMLPLTTSAQAAGIPGLEGDGSMSDPLVIDSVGDLDAAVSAVTSDATTFAGLSYRLDADIDYGGATFAGFPTFSGTFDGNGHTISNLVLGNHDNHIGFFRYLVGATVTGLTLRGVTGVTIDGTAGAGILTRTATDSVIAGNTVIDAAISLGVGGAVNTQAGGIAGSTTGATTVRDNLLWHVSVTGHKYAAGIVAYPNTGARIERNLLVDVTVHGDAGGSGATAALLHAQGAGRSDVSGNVVIRGGVSRSGSGVSAVGPSGMTSTTDNLVSTATTVTPGSAVGAEPVLATLDPSIEPDLPDLTGQSTYEGLGWTFDSPWIWHAPAQHPIAATTVLPVYRLTYDLAGGELAEPNPSAYTLGDGVTLANPTRVGHEFAGWTGTDLTGAQPQVTIPSGALGDRDYTAAWTPIEYTVAYDLAGGSLAGANPTTYDLESAAFTLVAPTREGYEFAGWVGTDLTEPTLEVTIPAGSTGNRAYTATWSGPVAYAIAYDLAGGVVDGSNPASYDLETDTFTLTNPTREGYEFAGWIGTDLSGATERVRVGRGSIGERAYTATWTPIAYAITHDLAGGTVRDGNHAHYTAETETFTLVNPTRPGYVFAGWIGTDLTEPQLDVTVTTGSLGDRSYAATWEPRSYAITTDLRGGNLENEVVAAYNVESAGITLPEPTRAGHDFTGWVGTGLDAPTMTVTIATGSTGNRSYVATWQPIGPLGKSATTLLLKVVKKTKDGTTRRKPRRVRIVLRSQGSSEPTGKIRIIARGTLKNGTSVKRVRTVRAKGGEFRAKLPAGLQPGAWRVRAIYRGDADHQVSRSASTSFRVKKKK